MLEIPKDFLSVPYDSWKYPGNAQGLQEGANCQHFAFEFLRYFGFKIDNFRSSDLWEDRIFTTFAATPQIMDLVLFNDSISSFGAHVGVCIGNDKVFHLCKSI